MEESVLKQTQNNNGSRLKQKQTDGGSAMDQKQTDNGSGLEQKQTDNGSGLEQKQTDGASGVEQKKQTNGTSGLESKQTNGTSGLESKQTNGISGLEQKKQADDGSGMEQKQTDGGSGVGQKMQTDGGFGLEQKLTDGASGVEQKRQIDGASGVEQKRQIDGASGVEQKRQTDGGSGLESKQTEGASGQEQKKQNGDNSGPEQEQTKSSIDIDLATPYGHTLLHFAVSKRNREEVVNLLAAGASINSKDFLRRTALHFAVGEGWIIPPRPVLDTPCDMQILKCLLNHPSVDINPVDHVGETPLMWAVKKRNSIAVNEFLKRNANPDIPNKDNRTPLHEALSAQPPNKKIVFSLLIHVAGIYGLDNLQQTPVDIIVRNVCDDKTLSFAKNCLYIIAARYQIRENLKLRLEKIPELSVFFNKCCEEVRQAKSYKIYDNVTVHDFALDCFQCRDDVYTPVVAFLLTREIVQYFNTLINRIPKAKLRNLLTKITGDSLVQDLLPPDATHSDIFIMIKLFYEETYYSRLY